MTDNSLRTAIARALYEHELPEGAMGWPEQMEAALSGRDPGRASMVGRYLAQADAVLKVLADPPAEVVVQAAQALCPDLWGGILQALPHVIQCHGEGWNSALRRAQDERLGTVQAVLAALVGGENDAV